MKLVYKDNNVHCITETLYKLLLEKKSLMEAPQRPSVSLKSIIKSRLKKEGINVNKNMEQKINSYIENINDVSDVNKIVNDFVKNIKLQQSNDTANTVNQRIVSTQVANHGDAISGGIDSDIDAKRTKNKKNNIQKNKNTRTNQTQNIDVQNNTKQSNKKVDLADISLMEEVLQQLRDTYKGNNVSYVDETTDAILSTFKNNKILKNNDEKIKMLIQKLLDEYRISNNYTEVEQSLFEKMIQIIQKYINVGYSIQTMQNNEIKQDNEFYSNKNKKNLIRIFKSIGNLSESIIKHIQEVFTMATGTLGGTGAKGSASLLVGGYNIERQSIKSSYKSTVLSYYMNAVNDTANDEMKKYMETVLKNENRNTKIIDAILQSCYVMTCNNSLLTSYINAIRYDDYLSSKYSIRTLSKMKPLGADEQVLYFVSNSENSERAVVCLLVVKPTFAVLRKLFKNGLSLPKVDYKI